MYTCHASRISHFSDAMNGVMNEPIMEAILIFRTELYHKQLTLILKSPPIIQIRASVLTTLERGTAQWTCLQVNCGH